ncbi:MAG: hypothetical protein ACLS43_01445 [Evtepia gabavorous]
MSTSYPKRSGAIAAIYDHIHTEEEAGRATVGWVRGSIPPGRLPWTPSRRGICSWPRKTAAWWPPPRSTRAGPRVRRGRLTQDAPEQVMVLHTLVVDPQAKGRGYGSRFVDFYES